MVGHDAHLAMRILHEQPRLVNNCNLAVRIGEENVAHASAAVRIEKDRGILGLELAPLLEGKANVSGVVGTAADEISQRTFAKVVFPLASVGLNSTGPIW